MDRNFTINTENNDKEEFSSDKCYECECPDNTIEEKCIRGPRGQRGIPGPEGCQGPRGHMGIGKKGDIGKIGPIGLIGPTGPSGGPPGPKGPIGPTGNKGSGHILSLNWFHKSRAASLDSDLWDGSRTVKKCSQTYHIYNSPVTEVTATLIFGVKCGTKGILVSIDEILPINFNVNDVENPMKIIFKSVVGNINTTVLQGLNDETIKFSNIGDSYEIVKVVLTICPTSQCSIWKWRVTKDNASGCISLYNLLLTNE